MDTLENYAKKIEKLRAELLFDDENITDVLPNHVFAEQHFLAALAQLELAQRAMMLAHYHMVRDLADARR